MASRLCLGGRHLIPARGPSRCPTCQHKRWKAQDSGRGTSTQRGYDAAWRRLSAAVIARDGGACQLRGPRCTGRATTADHVLPKSRGGQSVMENLQAACSPCNSGKRDRVAQRRAQTPGG